MSSYPRWTCHGVGKNAILRKLDLGFLQMLHRQWRDLAFCLTVVSLNERSMRVLYENLPSFADKLCLTEVYQAFEFVLSNAKKFTKPDGMSRLEEFETKIKEFHQKGVADEEALRRAEIAAKATKRRSRVTRTPSAGEPVRRNIRRARPPGCSTLVPETEEIEGEATPTNRESVTTPAVTRARRGPANTDGRVTRPRRKGRVVFSSDESTSEQSDETDED
ncbi:unnamed protein product [Dicrocoelium dendriticum]|nr:unnamed protein product [Dicrocoelium dendriticum]